MRLRTTPLVATASVIAVAGATFILPTPCVRSAIAGGASQDRALTGLLRDFRLAHADFGVLPAAGAGHYAGNVEPLLADGRPAFAPGDGYRVDTRWEDEGGRPIAPIVSENADDDDACGNEIEDEPGATGPTDNGAITSSNSFAQWFRDVPGENLSLAHTITLARDGAGVWSYLDDAFHPLDGRGFGNESGPHNDHFTYGFQATFTYKQCWQQWLEFQGGDGVWVFIDGELVIDLGGVAAPDEQYIALDRLGLTHDETYTLDFFYAQRHSTESVFCLRTTIDLASTDVPHTVSAAFD